MKKILLLVCMCIGCNYVQSQNKKVIDSLMRAYHQTKHDTSKINVLCEIMDEYYDKPDTAIVLAQRTLAWSEKVAYAKGQAYSLYHMGLGYHHKNNYTLSLECYQKSAPLMEQGKDYIILLAIFNNIATLYDAQGYYTDALEYYQKAISISEKLKNHYNTATCLTNMGNVYKNMGNYPISIEYYFKGLKIFEELKHNKNIAYVYNNIGIVYLNQRNLPFAEDYFFKSLKIREQINDKKGMASCLNNIGNLYLNQKNTQDALAQYQKSLAIYEEIKDIRGQAIALNNIGDIYNQMLKQEEALKCYQRALSLNQEMKNKWGMTYSLLGLARTELASKNYDKGITCAEKSLGIAQEIKGLAEIKNAYRNLFILYREKGDYQKALEYHQYFTETKDSILNEQNTKIIANLEAKTEAERKEKKILLLNKDNELKRLEAEREKNMRLATQKQLEADQLFAQARQEKDKHKHDSLQNLAQKIQLEADKLKAKEKQLEAEGKARQLEIIKEKEARQAQLYMLYLALGAFLIVAILAYFMFLAQQKEKKAKELIAEQKEEISQQNEEINQQKDVLALQAQELEMANQTKDKLFAILGHDLRSPIGSLEGVLNLMNTGAVSQEEFQSFIPQFHKNVKNMQNTLENLLQWSVSQMKGMNATPSFVNLQGLIEEKINLFATVAQAKNITISTQTTTNLTAWADLNHVRLILRNLINNAIKFTPKSGQIIINVHSKDNQVVVNVIDTGVGMSEEQAGKLFDKSQSFTTYGTSGEKGTGLGLQLCQEIVIKNGGSIWAHSEQGKGSTFSFSLPTKPA